QRLPEDAPRPPRAGDRDGQLLRLHQLRPAGFLPNARLHRPGRRRLPAGDGLRPGAGHEELPGRPARPRALRARCRGLLGHTTRSGDPGEGLPAGRRAGWDDGRIGAGMRPPNFYGYWENIDAELEAIPARPLIEEIPLRSNEHAILYGLRLTSIGPYRIFGYLSVPRGEGPFPALYLTPWYGSVNHIPDYNDRMRYVCLQIMHRGQRLADQPYSAAYPGLLTEGIDDPEQYAFRGIAADCLRGAEYLLSHPAVDTGRVAIQGDDLALIVAARRGGFGTVVIDDLLFYRLAEARATTSPYPIEEVNAYLRANPDDQDDVE